LVTVREGRKRQLRRVAAVLGHPVKRLQRIKLGPLELGKLPSGQWRELTEDELETLQAVRSASRTRKAVPRQGEGSRPSSAGRRRHLPAKGGAERKHHRP
jgi:hypothetical protein